MDQIQSSQNKSSSTTRRLQWILLVAFLIAAILTAYLTFIAVRDFVASWQLTNLPGVAIVNQPTSTPDAAGVIRNPQAPLQPSGGPTPQPWDGASRVTVLVMGLDYRDWLAGEGAPRTDSMILLTIDPVSRTEGMLSIPRDLWVNIPGGYGYGRINTAYSIGEGNKLPASGKYPGGGPGLAMKTVEELLGVPIDYYAQIDFSAFVQFVDEIGGVKIDVPQKIEIDPLGDNNNKTLKPGVQTLPGDLALAYARARHTEGGDFDRAQRQQQVILAIRHQIVSFDMLPTLITKSPALYKELSAGVHTNLSLEQVIQLAWLAQQIPEDRIKKGIIAPPDMVTLVKSPQGDDVLKPITEKIRALRDEIFTDSGPISPETNNMSPTDLMKAEAAKVSVLNGSTTSGLAARTTTYLQSQGVTVTNTGNADGLYANTTIYDYTGKPYTVKFLADLMGVSPNRIFSRYDPTSQVDVVVVLAPDWAANNQMP